MGKNKKIDFITLKDHDSGMIKDIISSAAKIKAGEDKFDKLLAGKSIALLFNKHSTRTRLSFEAGISQHLPPNGR